MSTGKTTPYRTKEGDRWEDIAERAYGNPDLADIIIDANKDVILEAELPGGLVLDIPVLEDKTTGTKLPSWMGDEDDVDDSPDEVDPSIPIVVGPPQPLAFSGNYPIVEDGKRIKFAINTTGNFSYSVEKQSGGVVFSSPLYAFTAGFAISTPDIQDGGYYIVKVGGTLVSGPLTVEGTSPLAFVQLPVITKVGSTWLIKYSVNKTGTYATKIIDLASSSPVYNQPSTSYTEGLVVTLQLSTEGNYRLEVGPDLTYNFSLTDQTETTTPPAWLTHAGYKYDANSHEFTLSLGTTEAAPGAEVNVTAMVGTNPNGKDQDNNAWNSGTYNPGTTAYALSPYTERFSFNPLVAASGGLEPAKQYKFRIRRTSVPGDIFVLVFTMPTETSAPGDPVPIDLEEPSTACPTPPTVQQIVQADSDNVTFLQSASGVNEEYWRILRASDDAVVRQGSVIIFDSNGVPQFNPSNQITVGFTPLTDDTYKFQVQGKNCTSPWSTAVTFEVTDGIIPADETLEVAVYANSGGTNEWKIRANGTAPYDIIVTDGTDEIYSTTSTSDETEIPNSVMTALGNGRLVVEVVDADNKQGTISRYKVDRDLMRALHVGFSIANGNITNHKNAITNGAARDFTYAGTIFPAPNTDADFAILEAGPYDHEVTTTFAYPYDETVRFAWQNSMWLRLGVTMVRDNNKLRNTTTRLIPYSENALMMRQDGVTPLLKFPTGPVPLEMIPSPSSTEFRTYAKRLMLAVVKRYKKAIQNGVIGLAGFPIGSAGEFEYQSHMKGPAGEDEGYSKGDFHPECVAAFKVRFPEYASLSNNDIAAADLTGSPLALAWSEHLLLQLVSLNKEVWDYVYEQVPDLNRDMIEQYDCGSYTDELAPYRRTQNVFRLGRKTSGLFKINDDPGNDSNNRLAFWLDHLSSLSRRFSCCAIYEPSPQGANFDPGQPWMPYVYDSIEFATARGIGESWVTVDTGWVDNMVTMTSLPVNGALLEPKDEFEISGSDKIITRLTRKISDVFKTGALGGWEDAHTAFRTANSLTHVDTLSVDDIVPEGTVDPGPGPGPDPGGTGVFTPVIAFYGFIEHFNVVVTGFSGSTSEDWRITDLSSVSLASGNEWWYLFDTFVYKTSSPISDFPYQSNFPLMIKKMGIKIGTDTLYRWANPGETQYIPGFSDPNLGQSFSPNSSGAAVQIGFQEITD